MNKKTGTAGSVVTPLEPIEALPADLADPGEMAQIKAKERGTQSGKYGATPVKAYKPPESEEDKQEKKHWIEIELKDQDGAPVAGESYRIVLPDGETLAEGTLDDKGFARLDGIDAGTCKITFPNLDKTSWKAA